MMAFTRRDHWSTLSSERIKGEYNTFAVLSVDLLCVNFQVYKRRFVAATICVYSVVVNCNERAWERCSSLNVNASNPYGVRSPFSISKMFLDSGAQSPVIAFLAPEDAASKFRSIFPPHVSALRRKTDPF